MSNAPLTPAQQAAFKEHAHSPPGVFRSPVEREPMPRGPAQTKMSAEKIAKRIWKGKDNPLIWKWARQTIAAAKLPDRRGFPNPDSVMDALYARQKREVAFAKDPVDTELMADAVELLCLDPDRECLPAGDCDEQTIVLGSAAMAVGIRIRLRIRTYKAHPPHVALVYDSEGNARAALARGEVPPAGGGPWKCKDPSVESGACSNAPYEGEFFMDVDEREIDRSWFAGVGAPPMGVDSALGDAPSAQLSPEESAVWMQQLSLAKQTLDRSISATRANTDALIAVRKDLGFPDFDPPPATEVSPGMSIPAYGQNQQWTQKTQAARDALLQTAQFLSTACGEALSGARQLYWNKGDLFVEWKEGDPFRVLMAPDANGTMRPTYFEPPPSNAQGDALGLGPVLIGVIVAATAITAVVGTIKICNYLTQASHDDAQVKTLELQNEMVKNGASPKDLAALSHANADLAKATHADPDKGSDSSSWAWDVIKWPLVILVAAGSAFAGYNYAKRSKKD